MAHVTLLPLKFGSNLVLAFKMKNKIAKRVSVFIIYKQRPPPSPAPSSCFLCGFVTAEWHIWSVISGVLPLLKLK